MSLKIDSLMKSNKLLHISLVIFLAFIFFIPNINAQNKNKKKKKKSEDTELHYKVSAIFIDGCKEKLQGNKEKAVEYYLTCLHLNPKHDASMYELASIYANRGDLKNALLLIEKAIDIEQDNNWYLMLYVGLLQQKKDYKKVVNVFKILCEKNLGNDDFQFDLATAYILSLQPKKAIKVYNELEKKNGVTEEISLNKRNIYLKNKDYSSAINELVKLTKEFPKEIKYYNLLAELYENHGMYEHAEVIYNKILKLDPNNEYIHFTLSNFYLKKGDSLNAFEEMRLAFKEESLPIDAKVKILLNYYSITERMVQYKDQAFDLLKVLIETHPNDPKSHSIYADFLYRDQRLEEAVVEFKKVVELDSSRYVVWETLILLESETKQFELMEKHSSKALELFPEQLLLYLFNGASNYELQNYNKAIEVLKEGISNTILNKEILTQLYSYLADSYYKNNQFDMADLSYDKVLKYDSNNVYVLNNYSYYLSLRNDRLDDAEKMAEKVHQLKPENHTYLDTYGWVMYKREKYVEAKKLIGDALKYGGSGNSIINEHYGDVLYRLEEYEEALKYWIKAKEVGKGSEFLNKKISEKKLFE